MPTTLKSTVLTIYKFDPMPDSVGYNATIVMKNVMSASVTPPPRGFSSRLEYWEKATGRKASICAHEICGRRATEGAIALRAFSADKAHYVFPACETCARRTEMLYVIGPIVKIDMQ